MYVPGLFGSSVGLPPRAPDGSMGGWGGGAGASVGGGSGAGITMAGFAGGGRLAEGPGPPVLGYPCIDCERL